jgi:tartrate/fumarate subfamily iron-sulfur-dependent hydro-lyase beta chain
VAVLTPKKLEYPFTLEKIKALRAGDVVNVTGRIFTARDRLHKYLYEGGKLPVPLKDGAIYHCGPAVVRKEGAWLIRAAGPTTSMREEPYMPKIIAEHQVRVIIGKGGMGEGTRKACMASGCVYLQAVGGAAQLLAARIGSVAGVHFLEEFGATEALWDLEVKDLPAVVAIDTSGRSLYRRIEGSSRAALRRVMNDGAGSRG